jgi:hypothetical protein
VPLKQEPVPSGWSILLLASFFGVRGRPVDVDNDEDENSTQSTSLASRRRGDRRLRRLRINTEPNRKYVGDLVKVWNESSTIILDYSRLGSEFPVFDSVDRDHSKFYFVQGKTGKVVKDAARWIEKVFVYSKLLLKALGIPANIEVVLLVGSEPSKRPVLGKRKRDDINKKHRKDKRYKIYDLANFSTFPPLQ